ncbi:hypothetical protein F4553_006062 [Allocatelliglobosispora scoriae]|uniref:Uncharacterized protein n=1 Tax=Allocatelliglobosispora scoriae TaxID=643052 RepID=A0A841BYR3_9ACTN|nr:hypothetical protein [Allocatelliglobosispora scoriae]MBB5872628.1 hypothetical protein [Allocatelliglobosispora scoriae]
MSDNLTEQLIVQLPTGRSDDDLELRYQLEEAIDAALTEEDLGELDGGDIGTGTMNVFAYVRPEQWQEALAVVRGVLSELELTEHALIARRNTMDEDAEPEIVWPEGSERDFAY